MSLPIPGGRRRREFVELRFVWDNAGSILVWPGVCLILGALLWGIIDSDLNTQKRTLEKHASTMTASLSKGYAQHLARVIEQLDQLTLQAKYRWEETKGNSRLELLKRNGLFTVRHAGAVTIFDRDGIPVTSTYPINPDVSIAERDYFAFHKNSDSASVHIGTPVQGMVSGKEIIPISRRLNDAAGSFDGVVVVSVEPVYFSLFADDPVLGAAGLLALTGKDGGVRMTRVGNMVGARNDPLLLQAAELAVSKEPVLLSGTRWFVDGKARLVASHSLDPYPYFAVVGLSQEQIFRPYEQSRAASRSAAIAASLVLVLFAIVATFLSLRLAWRKHLAEAVRDTYRVATEGGNEAYLMGRPIREETGNVADFEIVDCNDRASSMLGTGKERLINTRLSAIYQGAFFEKVMTTFRAAVESGFYEDEYEVPSGSIFTARWLHRRMVRSGEFLAVTLRDISAQKAHERELIRLATQDTLTGLPNRHWLMSNLPKVLERATTTGKQLAILSVDLDDFKHVNDSAGHSVGDQMLQVMVTRMRTELRPTDGLVRIGGDEFAVVLDSVASTDDVSRAARRILDALHLPIEIGEHKHAISASIGISLFPRDGVDAGALLNNADIAMYSAKAQSKGQFGFYDEKLYEGIRKRLDTEHELSRALDEDHFVMHYQPRVNAISGELVGMEALVRWMHPERGLIAPNDFIPLAESTGMILALGELIMKKTCAQLASWIAHGLPVVPISVNVSARQFSEGKVSDMIAACLGAHEIKPEMIEIELTESAMMGDFDVVMKEVHAINALGVKIHVDDFGTGYSSLSLLHRLDMDVLKVDRAFTNQLGNGKDGEIFFAAIVSMAKALGMSVIAEGVETAEQLRILQALDCDEIQGFFVSRPLPADDVPAIFRRRALLD
jgi:diguanylate cyclase (GGDEF)-like protein